MKLLSALLWQRLRVPDRNKFAIGGTIFAFCFAINYFAAFFRGSEQQMIRGALDVTSGIVNVTGFRKKGFDSLRLELGHADKVAAKLRAALPEFSVRSRIVGWCRVVGQGADRPLWVMGADLKQEERLVGRLQAGSGASGPDTGEKAQLQGLVLFREQAEQLHVEKGDTVTVMTETFDGLRNAIDVPVAFVSEEIGNLTTHFAFLPMPTARELFLLPSHATSVLQVDWEGTGVPNAQETMQAVRGALQDEWDVLLHEPFPSFMWPKMEPQLARRWKGQKLDLTTWEDQSLFTVSMLKIVELLSMLFVVVLGLPICLGLLNIVVLTVRRRTKEIGTLRALGMRKSAISILFLSEYAILGILAAFLGSALGMVLAKLTDLLHVEVAIGSSWRVIMTSGVVRLLPSFDTMVVCCVSAACLSALVSFQPALRAARILPLEAMKPD